MSVLIIDEAQNLTEELLEQVRLLSNIETDDRKLLQIVLLGQPELRDRLNSPRLRQLRQRITVRYHLKPLTRFEVTQYIQHRLELAGAKGVPFSPGPRCGGFIFTAGAFRGSSTPSATRRCSPVMSNTATASPIAWWAAPSANWKGTFTHEPDQRCAQARPGIRSGTIRRPARRRCRPSNLPRAAAPAGFWRRRRFCFSPPRVLFLGPALFGHKAGSAVDGSRRRRPLPRHRRLKPRPRPAPCRRRLKSGRRPTPCRCRCRPQTQ